MRETRITIAELKAKTAPHDVEQSGGFRKYENFWPFIVLRGASFYVAWLLLRLGISANVVTYFAFAIGCVGSGLVAFSNHLGMVVGALLINVWYFLDYVDGNVARGSNCSSDYGNLLDHLSFFTVNYLVFLAAGIGVFRHPDSHLDLLAYLVFHSELNRGAFLVLGGWAGVCSIFPLFITYLFERIFLCKLPPFATCFRKGNWLNNTMKVLGCNLGGTAMLILLLAVALRFLSVFLLFYSLFYTAVSILTATKLISKARHSSGKEALTENRIKGYPL